MSNPIDPALTTPAPEVPSTAGMTTKVVKGSIWTLAGTVVPLVATFVSTPFTIRFLGSEAYGVLILVGLIPNYLSFADFGMAMASTRFGSQQYGVANRLGEAKVVRSAGLIGLVSSLCIALPLILLAPEIIGRLGVPSRFQSEAILALRLTSVSLVLTNLSSIFNTPQLSRLRMDLNAIINASARSVLALGTAFVLYLGSGVVGAAAFMLIVSSIGLVAHLIVSSSLLPELKAFSVDRAFFKPLFKFGAGMLISGIAGLLLVNFEKILLSGLTTVKQLAYYSVAFTLANMATMFSWAMVQSLIPAFSQLLAEDDKSRFGALVDRSARLSIVWLLPTICILMLISQPFFTLWAGAEFGRESSFPFYILLAGILFNVVGYVPYASLLAAGRTDLVAKAHWSELLPYVLVSYLLINYFGIAGAAAAWSLRAVADAILLAWFSKSSVGIWPLSKGAVNRFILGAIPLAMVVSFGFIFSSWFLIAISLVVGVFMYSLIVWKSILKDDERAWVTLKWSTRFS